MSIYRTYSHLLYRWKICAFFFWHLSRTTAGSAIFARCFFLLALYIGYIEKPAGSPHNLTLAGFVKDGGWRGRIDPGTFSSWTNPSATWPVCIRMFIYIRKKKTSQKFSCNATGPALITNTTGNVTQPASRNASGIGQLDAGRTNEVPLEGIEPDKITYQSDVCYNASQRPYIYTFFFYCGVCQFF